MRLFPEFIIIKLKDSHYIVCECERDKKDGYMASSIIHFFNMNVLYLAFTSLINVTMNKF